VNEQHQARIEELERENERLRQELQAANEQIASLKALNERYALHARQRR
jgi:FtsZ-binding cell division protein ZapB